MRIPSLKIKIMLESIPLKSRILILVRRLAVVQRSVGVGVSVKSQSWWWYQHSHECRHE